MPPRGTSSAPSSSRRLSTIGWSARVRFYETVIHGFLDEPLAEEALGRELLGVKENWLPEDVQDSAFGAVVWNLLMRGRIDEAWLLEEDHLRRVREAANSPDALYKPVLSLRLSLLGALQRGYELPHFIDRVRQLSERLDYPAMMFWSHLLGFQVSARAPTEEAEASIQRFKSRARDALRNALQELKVAATNSVLRCHYHVVRGGWLREQGKLTASWRELDRAERLAAIIDAPGPCAELAIQRAEICSARKQPAAAQRYATQACELAAHIGGIAQERRWAQRFGLVRKISLPAHPRFAETDELSTSAASRESRATERTSASSTR